MKKILQINTILNSGSTGRIAESIGILAMENGWESYIAYSRGKSSSSHKIKIGNKLDVYIHFILTRILDIQGFGSFLATKFFIGRIKKINPDIIHIHNIHGYYINIQVLLKYIKKTNTPVIFTLHDCWNFTGHCTHFEMIKCNKWQYECENCPQTKEYPASYFIDNSKKNYIKKKNLFNKINNAKVVSVSKWLDKIVDSSFLNHIPHLYINNGVNVSIFKRSPDIVKIKQKFNINDKFIIIGVATVWTQRKGLFDFIDLAKLISQDTIIILVGLSKQQIKTLPTNIIGIEKTENINELVDLYSCSNIFLNLTYEDSFPTTNLEAMSCGTPVLTYKTGGSTESVSTETGFVVEKGDLKSVVDIIRLLKESNKEYNVECRKYAEEKYNDIINFKKYIDIYNEMLQ